MGSVCHCDGRAPRGLGQGSRCRITVTDRHGDVADSDRADRRVAAAISGIALASMGAARSRRGIACRADRVRPAARLHLRSGSVRNHLCGRERSDFGRARPSCLWPRPDGEAPPDRARRQRRDEPPLCDREHPDPARRQGRPPARDDAARDRTVIAPPRRRARRRSRRLAASGRTARRLAESRGRRSAAAPRPFADPSRARAAR